ncbi:MAG: hypothetical protein IJE09_04230 [Oscillospiraceae bacterium]|nr:hypothetical protein [Oscillospiraceae bacterium]
MKKRIVALALVVLMLTVAVIGGTMAYFTDTDDATNTFTFGNVSIVQNEKNRDGDTFEQNQVVYPAIHEKLTKGDVTVDGYTFKIRSLEGNYIDKIVNVTNDGTEEAYVRTIIAIPSINGYDDTANASNNPLHWNYLDASDFNGTGWDWNGSNDAEVTSQKCYAQDVMIGGVAYDLYVATYNAEVAKDETTSPSMVGFYLDNRVNYDENGYFQVVNGERRDLSEYIKPDENGMVTMKILVASQACQTEGFADAWEALDKAFGAISATNNPWVK